MGFICNEFSIKLVKIAQDSEVRDLQLVREWTTCERSHEKYMLEAKESTCFMTHLVTWPTYEMTHKMH